MTKFVRDVAFILWGTNVLKKRCLKLTKAMEERDKDIYSGEKSFF